MRCVSVIMLCGCRNTICVNIIILIFPVSRFGYTHFISFVDNIILCRDSYLTANTNSYRNILSDSNISYNGVAGLSFIANPIKIIFVILPPKNSSKINPSFHQLIQNNVFNSMETTTNIIVFNVILYNQIIKPHDSFP